MDVSKRNYIKQKVQRVAHLNGIKAFEASARHLSFAGAAQELNVTPAAVGQQVRQLEEWLGVKLFIRATSGASRLSLTEEAIRAFPEIQRGFSHILKGLSLLKEESGETVITLSASPSIASKWLLPKIDDFQNDFPDIDIHVETDVTLVDYSTQGIDIGIRYGMGQWPNLSVQHLMFEDVFPVCSPDFMEKYQLEIGLPETLDHIPLIHDHSVTSSHLYPSWSEWCEKLGVPAPERMHGLKINNFSSVMESAIRGKGLALARGVLVVDELERGQLVCPFDRKTSSYPSSFCYYLVWRNELDTDQRIIAFRRWLLSQVSH
ncbi:LysR family transcriptional regulator [Enterovibrio norvegicus FF-33]|uniref:LysR family transcriptional regulator n=2 Tax=Enterovibrio norvegicus TaxID=188144 RepID=A0A1E5CFG0_9GAMM|nr:LysR substrate-binding domain-containing protein [Enterovibrio norvegicus]OEE64258.1 LysR family transcriptional regulator [Enterovibrio norvegicus FF-454]OEE66462.1 LysR family transcriptional regulator [Enterovibrio norvegicus FF-33]